MDTDGKLFPTRSVPSPSPPPSACMLIPLGESLRLDENDIVTFCVPFGSTDRNGMDNGEFRYSNEISGRVSIGTVVRVNCSLGYRVEGASASVCTSNNWKPSTIGRCIQDIGEFTGFSPLSLHSLMIFNACFAWNFHLR